MHQIVLAIAAVLTLLTAGAAGNAQANAGVRSASSNQPISLRPMDIFPPTGL